MRSVVTGVAVVGMWVAGVASAAGAGSGLSLRQEVERAATVVVTHAPGANAPASAVRMQQYTNEDQLITWEGGGVLLVCERVGLLKLPAGQAKVAEMPVEQRQMLLFTTMMGTVGSIATVMDAAGPDAVMVAAGPAAPRVVEKHWAYGVERSEISSQRLANGDLQLRLRKLETVTTRPPSSPEDLVNTDDDLAARLAELPAVGSWTEVVVSAAPRPAQLPGSFAVTGWVATTDAAFATVDEVRASAACAE